MQYLTMNIYINAWLDCSNPFISIHNKHNNDLLAHFNTENINRLINDGELCIEDLQSTNADIQIEVASNLLALKTAETIKQQIHNMGLVVKKRESILTINAPATNKTTKKDRKQIIQMATIFPFPSPAL